MTLSVYQSLKDLWNCDPMGSASPSLIKESTDVRRRVPLPKKTYVTLLSESICRPVKEQISNTLLLHLILYQRQYEGSPA